MTATTTATITAPGYCGPAGGPSIHHPYDLNVSWTCRRNALADGIRRDIETIADTERRRARLTSEFKRRNLAEFIEYRRALTIRLLALHADTPCTCTEPYDVPVFDVEQAYPACSC